MTEASQGGKRLRVLLIEDYEEDALLLLRALRKGGFSVDWKRVETLEELREALEESWDLILSDYNLPEFQAPEALRLVQERGLNVPFFVVSGVVGEETAVLMLKAGAHDYLLKDRLDRLVPAIERELRDAKVREERSAAEAALRESEERLRLAVEATGFGTYDYDLRHRHILWSSQLYAICGLPDGMELGKDRILEIIHPDDREHFTFAHKRSIFPGGSGSHEIEYRIVRPDGQTRWLSDLGKAFFEKDSENFRALRLIGNVQDITERKQVERQIRLLNAALERKVIVRTEELQRSEQALAAFFAHAPLGLLWVAPDGTIQRVNRAFLKMLDLPESEVLGQIVSKFDNGELAAILEAVRGLEPVQDFKAHLKNRAGEVCNVIIDAMGVQKEGNLIRSEWFVRNISRRIELEREILSISEREQRRFGEDLHDDLCQTLAGIQFHCDSLARELAPSSAQSSEKMRDIAQLIREANRRAREMARGLSPMSLNSENLAEALEELAARANKLFQINCHVECQNDEAVHGESMTMHLYRIAQEAVANAAKHSGCQFILIQLTSTPEKVILSVTDDGKGMPDETERGKTKGMGLRVMQYRCGIIGGRLSIRPARAGGTKVVCEVKL